MSTTSVRLFAESVWVTRTEGLRREHDEVLAPLVAIGGGDRDGERRVRAVLERLGAIDLTCVDEVTLPLDCKADYVVRIDGDRHATATQQRSRLNSTESSLSIHAVQMDSILVWYLHLGEEIHEKHEYFLFYFIYLFIIISSL